MTLYTEAHGSLSAPHALGLHSSSLCSVLQAGDQETTTPPSLRSLTERFSSGSLFERPFLLRTSPPVNEPTTPPTPPPIDYHPAYRKRRPRHIPIVITEGLKASVLRNLPESPELQDTELNIGEHTPLQTLRLQTGFSQRRLRLQRHIPIIIPDYAQPYGPFPPPTPSSSGGSTPRQIISPVSPFPNLSPDMSRPLAGTSRPSTADSNASASSPTRAYAAQSSFSSQYQADVNGSQSSLINDGSPDPQGQMDPPLRPADATPHATAPIASGIPVTSSMTQQVAGTTNLSGLVCNVHRCTGKEPHALVGATTTILGDKLYVFGGRRLSRRRPQLTADLYELDLIRRHWTKLETFGNIPPPRYFHSVCALGDNKLICYGGMSPATSQTPQAQSPQQGSEQQPEVIVMSDIHIYDTNTRTWTHIPTSDNPQGRYAHCATVLPSSAVFSSANAPASAMHHNPSSGGPNQGSIGIALDGSGGAEMVVVGGQDSANHYIEQISVFNLRSLKWTSTNTLGRSCGAYRSVVAPLSGMPASKIGVGTNPKESAEESRRSRTSAPGTTSMLIYSNYNFLDVKLELQIRLPDGSLTEKNMNGQFSPPGLRFPNGEVLDHHFVVSGTYLTSSKQEYALWALDLRTLTWSRIDAGGSVFSQGSWNRGVLWPRRNTFVILGNRKRNLVEDYNHRRINFTNVCLVELEAFGLYDNPRHTSPTSSYASFSAPNLPLSLRPKVSAWSGGGRPHFTAAEELGQMVMNLRELSDMDILSISGERIPVNSHIVARRWGPYFVQLLREGSAPGPPSSDNGDAATLRPPTGSGASRNSSITITPSLNTNYSTSTLNATTSNGPDGPSPFHPPNSTNLLPNSRSRTLYLPHTPLTVQALVHYLYTSSLPPASHPLSTPQILCSLLQLARPYCIDGLLEAVVERLHQVMDGRNAAAVFNACAMAAGGGRGTGFKTLDGMHLSETDFNGESSNGHPFGRQGLRNGIGGLNGMRRRDTSATDSEDETSSVDGGDSGASAADPSEFTGVNEAETEEEVWSAERSCVIGLQKRGLRGLMEGRRMRERGRSVGVPGQGTD